MNSASGRVVRALDLELGPVFKCRSDHYLNLDPCSPKFISSTTLVVANWFASDYWGFFKK